MCRQTCFRGVRTAISEKASMRRAPSWMASTAAKVDTDKRDSLPGANIQVWESM
jgi:hypothetical protein